MNDRVAVAGLFAHQPVRPDGRCNVVVSRPTVNRPVAAHSTYGCALSNPFVLLLNTGRVESIPINHSFNIHRCTHSQQNMSFIRYKTRGTHTNAGIWGKAIAFRRVRPCPEDRPPDQPVVTWMSRPTSGRS